MIVGKPFAFLSDYVNQLSETLENSQITAGMTVKRQNWCRILCNMYYRHKFNLLA